MSEPIPLRTRKPQSKGAIIAIVVLFGLAALGIIESVVLITLLATGQIG